jgi:hypothetical protein
MTLDFAARFSKRGMSSDADESPARPAGVYFHRVAAGGLRAVRRMARLQSGLDWPAESRKRQTRSRDRYLSAVRPRR